MYNSPVVGGTGTVLGASTSAVLANTGSSTVVTVAAGVAIALVAWGLALISAKR